MHIALVNFYYNPNPVYANIAADLRQRGHTVWLGVRNKENNLDWHDGERIVATLSGPSDPSAAIKGIPILSSIAHRFLFFLFMLRLRRFVRQTKPDILQMNPGFFLFPWVLTLFMPRQISFIYDIRHLNVGLRHDLIGRLKEWQLVQAWYMSARFFYDHVCFCHQATAQKILGDRWTDRSSIVPVGIDAGFLKVQPPEPDFRNKVRKIRFIYVGAITRFRDLERLLAAVQQVTAVTTNFEVVFIGADKAEGYYHKMVVDMGLTDVVTIKPPIPYETVPDYMAQFDVGLAYIPDRKTWHYQPTIKVLEYRAIGIPILSINVMSHREYVEDGINGVLVENRVDDIAVGLQRFIQDQDFLEACWHNARDMRYGLTVNDITEMYERAYLKLKQLSTHLQETAVR